MPRPQRGGGPAEGESEGGGPTPCREPGMSMQVSTGGGAAGGGLRSVSGTLRSLCPKATGEEGCVQHQRGCEGA